ncbi:MAG TPA: M23 family metallopeptidase [Pyrinomonadaceae bacterium]|nr:M23 family metallopeptidase [Pyrinomonadaceae bacterium]
MHFTTVGIFTFLGLTVLSVGIHGLVNTTVLAPPVAQATALTQSAAKPTTGPATAPNRSAEPIDYSRPSASSELASGSGGPADGDLDADSADLENHIRTIQATTNQAYLPTMWAHLGKINNEFGFRRNPFGGRTYEFHGGMDIDGERGDLVVAPANGTVVAAGYKGGYGNMVEIDHGNGLTTLYGHLSKVESTQGDVVTRGQLIGQVGSTGRSTGPHLHYELRLNDKPINPRVFLPAEPTDLAKIVRR